MAILEVHEIRKKFDEEEILKGISFSMEKGQTLSIIGSSGSGKTTLLRCLNFLETPDEGTITVNGDLLYFANVTHMRRRLEKVVITLGWFFSNLIFFLSIQLLKM